MDNNQVKSPVICEQTHPDEALNESGDVDADFHPIVTLPEVEVSTNEENEDVLLKVRAKLYRFDTSNEDIPEWKERGTGELKLLQHRENNSVRIVMRRDKTLKVCANHFITPWMELKPSRGCAKAFIYTVLADFADEQAKSECLAVKFGTIDIANEFKEKFNEAKEIVRTKCHLYNNENDSNSESESENEKNLSKENNEESKAGSNEAEVTKKLSELDVKSEENKENVKNE